MLIEIKHRLTGAVLFSVEAGNLKLAVEIAVWQKVNLSGSDLSGSDLSDSNLRGSDLSGSDLSGSDLSGSDLRYSNLSGSRNIIRVGPTSDGYEFFAVPSDKGLMVKAGCHWFTYAEALAYYTADKRAIADERRAYLAAIAGIATVRGWALEAVATEAA